MSVVTFPRRVDRLVRDDVARPQTRPAPTRVRVHRRAVSPARRSAIVVLVAVTVSVAGSMLAASRQVQLQVLQNELTTAQSRYAQAVSSVSSFSTPGVVATEARGLHLVDPTTITQVPAVSLAVPLAPPRFTTPVSVTSRTAR